MGRKEAIRIAEQLGNHTAVEFTGGIVHGFHPIPNDELRVGGEFDMYGFRWHILKVEQTTELPIITIHTIKELP